MRKFLDNSNRYLIPVLLGLLLLQMITMPFVVGFTYAGSSESPEHSLTYKPNKLRWDNNTDINDQGVAELSLFSAEYDGVKSEDGRNVIAPGTKGRNVVRLYNKAIGPVEYVAVLYAIKSNEEIPVQTALETDGVPTDSYLLPEGVSRDQVIQAFRGEVDNRQYQDFEVTWLWEFEESRAQDLTDTYLGSQEELDDITVGLYIVVVDENDYSLPKTSDDSGFGMYLALMGVSGGLLLLLFWERRKERECEQ